MTNRPAAILAAIFLASTPAVGIEVVEQRFQVAYSHGGQHHVSEDLVVPLLPGSACYFWYLRLSEANASLQLVERFELPEPLADWGTTGTAPDDPTRIEQDGKVAITTLKQDSDSEGWVTHGWCVADGDPLGRHRIEVSADGAPLATYEFEVVAPEDYDFPVALTLALSPRSIKASW